MSKIGPSSAAERKSNGFEREFIAGPTHQIPGAMNSGSFNPSHTGGVYDIPDGCDPAPGFDFIHDLIRRNAGPVLQVSCTSGQFFVSCLSAGIDIDAVIELEEDLALRRMEADQMGAKPGLYGQSIRRLHLPRHYQTIILLDSAFSLLLTPSEALNALHRCKSHLQSGGILVLPISSPFAPGEALSGEKTNEWRVVNRIGCASDGTSVLVNLITDTLDPVEQVFTERWRHDLVKNGAVVESETRTISRRWWFRHQIVELLSAAGFCWVDIRGDFTDIAASDDHARWVLLAGRDENSAPL